mmetsp:Transcript_25315/g.63746  ORF Transcript_25315/g.63746 Transcript_25315/m.63746 type:complete len:380 (+) Transcript_25315:151-1290(+)
MCSMCDVVSICCLPSSLCLACTPGKRAVVQRSWICCSNLLHVIHRRRIHCLRGRRLAEVEEKRLGHLPGEFAVCMRGQMKAVRKVVPLRVHGDELRQADGHLSLADLLHIRDFLPHGGDRHLEDGHGGRVEGVAERSQQPLGLLSVAGGALDGVSIRLALVPDHAAQPAVGALGQRRKRAMDHFGEQLAAVLPQVNASAANRARDQPDAVCVAHVPELIGKRKARANTADFGGINVHVQRLLGIFPLPVCIELQDLAGGRLAAWRHHPVPCLARLGLNDAAPASHVALAAKDEHIQRLLVHHRLGTGSLRKSWKHRGNHGEARPTRLPRRQRACPVRHVGCRCRGSGRGGLRRVRSLVSPELLAPCSPRAKASGVRLCE